jgi:formate-dependent nitrite reductase membrane component NrfD
MEVQLLYNVFHHESVSMLIAIYFHIVGLHAGCSIVSITATLIGKKEYKPVAKIGAIFVIILFSISPIFLLTDLFQPLRFWYLFLHFNVSSPLSWGTFILCAYPTFTGIYIYFLFKGNVRWSKIFGVISLPTAIGVHGYTGFVLGFAKARVLWNTAVMPSYFLCSAMISGVAFMLIVALVRYHFTYQDKPLDEREKDLEIIDLLAKWMAGFMIMNVFYVFSDLTVMYYHTEDAFETVELVRLGKFSFLYIWVDNVLGNIVPSILIIFKRTRKSLFILLIAAILASIGVFIMRYVMVFGGQYVPLS